ncbi:CRISPR-associated protein Cas4 [Lutispora thermophila]|uniref:CRISPR-associated exonuclease Cas4 n=1 Tax=Lutispora thermophila DSM 19022 TaxID=1122184 RepID=A0A1M6E9P6_9FIRM|nr:CRISPR-associated protein Cas4 [Lutispora thermophila]SHI82143.1 CRISPR-associated exonuclease, Cas4 family [Lutispora thermophila DSM 19022]
MVVNGTLIWYYAICKREVWLMSRNITPDQKDTNIEIGRFLHETYYNRSKKEIEFGNVKFDVLVNTKDELVIGETKKTSKFEEASTMQLLYYIRELRRAGINAKGVLLYPEERKRVEVEFTEEKNMLLEKAEDEIGRIINDATPPPVVKNKYCKSCGYREYCYA